MKIGGPTKPTVPRPLEGSGPADPAAKTKPFPSPDADPVSEPKPLGSMDDLAQRIQQGQLTIDDAVSQLIETVAAEATLSTPELRAQLRQALEQLLEDDPVLAAALRGMKQDT